MGDSLPQGKVSPPPPLNPHVCFHFCVVIKGIEKIERGDTLSQGNFPYLVTMNTVRIYLQQRGTVYTGVKCPSRNPPPPPLNPHVCFHFYVMINGMRRALSSEVSESPSRGYWKQFLLSCPYEHSQYLPAVEGDCLPRDKSAPPPLNPHVCFHFYVVIKGIEKIERGGHFTPG